MRSLEDIESGIAAVAPLPEAQVAADELLALSEEVLEHWVVARGWQPTQDEREGFRMLALHRQGAKGDPSFNACRETCREIAYHYNLVNMQPEHAETTNRVEMMRMITSHLYLFISGKICLSAARCRSPNWGSFVVPQSRSGHRPNLTQELQRRLSLCLLYADVICLTSCFTTSTITSGSRTRETAQ
jgi:hypothetical protein